MLKKIKICIKILLSKSLLLDGLFRRIIWRRVSFPEIEMKLIDRLSNNSFDIALDVGAALGGYSFLLQSKAVSVFAFEPGAAHFNYLERVSLLSNITVYNYAVGSLTENKVMYTAGTDETALHTATLSVKNPVSKDSDVTVSTISQVALDSFLLPAINNGRSIDFIKIDVEGYEYDAIIGAKTIIETCKPLIICEIEFRHNELCADVFIFLQELGYQCLYYSDGKFIALESFDLSSLQQENDLKDRLSGDFPSHKNKYFNNFVFEHPETKVRLST
jgi:FkbM family methyltransferase